MAWRWIVRGHERWSRLRVRVSLYRSIQCRKWRQSIFSTQLSITMVWDAHTRAPRFHMWSRCILDGRMQSSVGRTQFVKIPKKEEASSKVEKYLFDKINRTCRVFTCILGINTLSQTAEETLAIFHTNHAKASVSSKRPLICNPLNVVA